MTPERWERRVWFDESHDALERLAREGEEVSAEYRTDVYLLVADEALLPKLRGEARFEIKRRTEVRDGLERWALEASEGFPLAPEEALRILPDAPAHALQTAEGFRAFAETLGTVEVVSIRKHRRRFRFGEAEAGITAVQGGRLPAVTLGIEAARREAASAAAEKLGIQTLPNEDYGAALRRARRSA